MRETTRHISPLQYAILETTAFMGIGIFGYPRELVQQAGHDALWGFLLDWAAAYFGVWLLLKVAYIDPRETLLGMARRIWPGPVYWVFGLLDAALHVTLPVIALAQFTFVIGTFFLPDTPVLTIEVVMIGMAVYIAWWELPPLARTVQVIDIPVMAVSVALLALMTPHLHNFYAIRPSVDLHLVPIGRGALKTFYIFVGFEAIPIFWPYVRVEDQPRARRYIYWALTLSGSFYTAIYIATLASESPWYLIHLEWPSVSALRLINITGLLIDKLGLLIAVFWGMLSLFFISLRLWAVTHVLVPMFRRRGLGWYRGIVVGLGALVLGLAHRLPNVESVDRWTARIVPVILLFIFLYPTAFVITAAFRKRRQSTHPGAPADGR
ncbi:MAG: GerAB/ArcD/ProY family transporter [Thermaerobacter sp.]|nr:GerAB/ArcD/ProY family transporter [Thermaerobacter sp.]